MKHKHEHPLFVNSQPRLLLCCLIVPQTIFGITIITLLYHAGYDERPRYLNEAGIFFWMLMTISMTGLGARIILGVFWGSRKYLISSHRPSLLQELCAAAKTL